MPLSRKELELMASQIGQLSALARAAEFELAAQLLDKAHETISVELGYQPKLDVSTATEMSSAPVDNPIGRPRIQQV